MSRQINQPINQVRLTNVAVVRINKGGKRFEIACYRNKVVDYRQGLEQDLSEVLQTERIFTNVSKGEFAKAKDLQKVFGTKDEDEIAKLILTKGQVQVSDKERSQQLEKTTAQIAEWISKNCVHPTSERPYTISQIRHAMQQANFSVHPTKPLKRQHLDSVKLLQNVIPIQRARMELLLLVPVGSTGVSIVETTLRDNDVEWNSPSSDSSSAHMHYQILVDPSLYRVLNEVVQTIEGARIEIVTQVVTKQGDVILESQQHQESQNEEQIMVEQASRLNDLSLETGDLPSSVESHQLDKTEVPEEYSEESGDEKEVLDVKTNARRRQQQKKAQKRNRKAHRREIQELEESEDEEDETTKCAVAGDKAAEVSIGASPALPTMESVKDHGSDSRKSCNTCGGQFDGAAAYRAHFKSDWHRFNQKLKLKGAAPVSEDEFKLIDADAFFGGAGSDNIF